MTDQTAAARTVEPEIVDAPTQATPPRASRAVAQRTAKSEVVPMSTDPMSLMAMAVQRGADVATVTQLNQLRMEVEKDNARKAFNLALSAAKKEIRPIIKNRRVKFESAKADAKNGKVDYAHEDLAGIAEQIDPILSEHGLSYYFDSENAPGQLTVICVIAHELGHEKRTPLSAAVDLSGAKNHLQGIGSAATYLQRYTLKLALGLSVTDDDDANGTGDGVGQSPNRAEPAKQEQRRPPRASQSQPPKGPHDIGAIKGETWPQWGERYITMVKTSNTTEEVKAWNDLNDANLEGMYRGAPDVYKEVHAAWLKHGKTLAANSQVGGNKAAPPAQGTEPPAQEPAKPYSLPGQPDPKADYEGFLKWCETTLATATDIDLERFWNEIVEPANCFETDKSDLMSLYRKAEQRLGG
jgi:hypothetical protein